MENFCFAEKGCFFQLMQSKPKKKSFFNTLYGNPFAPIQSLYAGVLWAKPVSIRTAGNYCKLTSGRALNHPRSPEVRKPLVYFWYFSYTRKVRKTFLSQEVSRFANLESAHRNDSFAPQQLKPLKKTSDVLQTSNQLAAAAASQI